LALLLMINLIGNLKQKLVKPQTKPL